MSDHLMMALAAAISPIVDAQRQLKVDTVEPNASPGQVAKDETDGASDGKGTQSATSAQSRASGENTEATKASNVALKRPAAAQPASDGSSHRRRVSGKQSET